MLGYWSTSSSLSSSSSARTWGLQAALLVSLFLGLADGRLIKRAFTQDKLIYSDCARDPDHPIRIKSVKITPMPIVSPGTFQLSFHANITQDIPETLQLDMTINKLWFGLPFQMPCINKQFGTCKYKNICHRLRRIGLFGCPTTFLSNNIPCHCPFTSGDYKMNDVVIRVPRIDGMFGILAQGDYEVIAKIVEEKARKELGCLRLVFSMKKRRKYRGWFFKR